MSKLDIHIVPVLKDNYVYLLREPDSGAVGIVDPSVAGPVIAALDKLGWKATHILNTHHHNDHTGGNAELKVHYKAIVVGPMADQARIPGIDVALADGDTFHFGKTTAKVFDVPGHTRGHIAYWFPDSQAAFTGDTLFLMGCGRLFEGTPAQMWNSLSKLKGLPAERDHHPRHHGRGAGDQPLPARRYQGDAAGDGDQGRRRDLCRNPQRQG
jgi:hydroxyacylglutathione hydrolase